jgi:hypothetical protein
MAQGKCAFCGTFVTGGGTALGRHSVACTACKPLAMKWLQKQGLLPEEPAPKDNEPEAAPA